MRQRDQSRCCQDEDSSRDTPTASGRRRGDPGRSRGPVTRPSRSTLLTQQVSTRFPSSQAGRSSERTLAHASGSGPNVPTTARGVAHQVSVRLERARPHHWRSRSALRRHSTSTRSANRRSNSEACGRAVLRSSGRSPVTFLDALWPGLLCTCFPPSHQSSARSSSRRGRSEGGRQHDEVTRTTISGRDAHRVRPGRPPSRRCSRRDRLASRTRSPRRTAIQATQATMGINLFISSHRRAA